MRFLLIVAFLTLFGKCFSQVQETVVGDTSIVMTSVYDGDTSFSLKASYRKGEWMVYYDVTHKDSAYYIKYFNNSYSSSEWYRDGQIKRILVNNPQFCIMCCDEQNFYPDGRVRIVQTCNSDSCITREYYHSEQLKKIDKSVSDSLHRGMMIWHYNAEYYENGQLKSDPTDPNGPRQTSKNYYASGKKSRESTWQAGALVGQYHEWHENGMLKVEGQYESPNDDGQYHLTKKTGKWTYYNENGKKIKEEFYEENKLVKTIDY